MVLYLVQIIPFLYLHDCAIEKLILDARSVSMQNNCVSLVLTYDKVWHTDTIVDILIISLTLITMVSYIPMWFQFTMFKVCFSATIICCGLINIFSLKTAIEKLSVSYMVFFQLYFFSIPGFEIISVIATWTMFHLRLKLPANSPRLPHSIKTLGRRRGEARLSI